MCEVGTDVRSKLEWLTVAWNIRRHEHRDCRGGWRGEVSDEIVFYAYAVVDILACVLVG